MNEHFLFYWLSWLMIVCIYFFMQNSKRKYLFLNVLLLNIITIHWEITIFNGINLSIAYIITLFSALYLFAQWQFSIYDIAVTITVIICYIALLIWEKISPVWFVIHPYVLIPLLLMMLIVLLNKTFHNQIAIAATSISIGHLIYSLILFSYHLQHNMIEKNFFIIVYIHIMFLFIFQMLTFIKERTVFKIRSR